MNDPIAAASLVTRKAALWNKDSLLGTSTLTTEKFEVEMAMSSLPLEGFKEKDRLP